MDCPRCTTRLMTMHTYSAGPSATTRNLKCPKCGYVASSVEFRVERPQKASLGKGGFLGGQDLRAKILKGEVRPPSIGGSSMETEVCTEASSAQSESS